jgi:hypothetical protein
VENESYMTELSCYIHRRLFGVSYSAISHIIADMKLKKTDSPVRNKLIKVNSQFKM